MTGNSFSSPMNMVKIDGAKIKLLREQQGLTQLYLATAVEVTTDTISRWENKRYPSIKKDNGLKLAEALNVQLEEILEEVLEEIPEEEQTESSPFPAQPTNPRLPDTAVDPVSSGPTKNNFLMMLSSGILLIVCVIFAWYFFYTPSFSSFSAARIIPPHSISGQPFPIIIEISGAPDKAIALIIKEKIPENGTVHATSPIVNAGGLKNNQIKWLKKIENAAVYAYVISVSGKKEETVKFSGTAAIRGDSEISINGGDTIVIGEHHWADTDADNAISDDEILAVYDQYSEITDIDLDIDLIEELWLGSKYLWDNSTATFKVID
jgi:transcriptional regulator with XRE-family HTH domain